MTYPNLMEVSNRKKIKWKPYLIDKYALAMAVTTLVDYIGLLEKNLMRILIVRSCLPQFSLFLG